MTRLNIFAQIFVWVVLGSIGFLQVDSRPTANLNDDALAYFMKYGYIRKFTESEDPKQLEKSIKRFQRNAYLPVTGKLDRLTMEQMTKPRCGLKDTAGKEVGSYVLQGGKWETNKLTWKVENAGYRITKEQAREVVRKATALWSKHANMDFEEVTSGDADLLISFQRYNHGDFYSFDGAGGTLAHAFFPIKNLALAGDIHFDDDEYFVIGSNKGTELTWVTIHELGHSLGLQHSYTREAIMYPWYKGYDPHYKLSNDDIGGIQALYGKRPVTTQEPIATKPPIKSWPCLSKIDAVFQPIGGGSWLFVLHDNKFDLASRTGALIHRDMPLSNYFYGINEQITAAVVNKVKTLNYIFVHNGYYECDRFVPIGGKKPLSALGLPSDVKEVDAALVWSRNRKVYLFSGTRYWRYNVQTSQMDAGYPRSITKAWKGVPDNLSAAVTGLDGITYFVKGSKYYALNDGSVSVKPGYPKEIGNGWLTCGASPGSLLSEFRTERKGASSGSLLSEFRTEKKGASSGSLLSEFRIESKEPKDEEP